VELLPADPNTGLDSIYARDATIICDRGVILCHMGKAARKTEPDAQETAFGSLGLPMLGAIGGEGTLEGGDVTWLDSETIAVGRGYRTNGEGIRQLRGILEPEIEVIEVALPHWRGPGDVFHLMSVLSPIDNDLALVYSPLMSVPFREELLRRDIQLVEVPDEEYDSMAGNVLAIEPRVCVQLSGNPVTRERLERAGVEVLVNEGTDISGKGCGGPTCLTRSLEREA
jgi:N-dimethylarginine dimethylaminohydrolase